MEHKLKTWAKYFDSVASGMKPFEVRKDDRNFQIGDVLILEEFGEKTGIYTGAWCKAEITYPWQERGRKTVRS